MLKSNLYVRNDFVNGERCLIFYYLYSTIEIQKRILTRKNQLQAVIRKNEYVLNYNKQINEYLEQEWNKKNKGSFNKDLLNNRMDLCKQLGITDEQLTDVWKELDVEPIIEEIKENTIKELGLQSGVVFKDVKQGMKVLDQIALGCFEVSDANNFKRLATPVVIDGQRFDYEVVMQLEDVAPNFEFRLDLNEEGKAIQQDN